MKTIKYMIIALALSAGLTSCVVHERGALYIRGHYENGPRGSYWVPGHYAR